MVGLSVLYKNTLYILTLPYILTKLYPFSNSSSGYMFVLKAHKDLWGHKHNSHTKSHNSALPFDKIVPLFHLKKFVLKNCSFPSNKKKCKLSGAFSWFTDYVTYDLHLDETDGYITWDLHFDETDCYVTCDLHLKLSSIFSKENIFLLCIKAYL